MSPVCNITIVTVIVTIGVIITIGAIHNDNKESVCYV